MGEGNECIKPLLSYLLFSSVITRIAFINWRHHYFLKIILGYFPNFQSSASVSVLPTSPDTLGAVERLLVLGRHIWPTVSPSHRLLLFMVFGYLPPSSLKWPLPVISGILGWYLPRGNWTHLHFGLCVGTWHNVNDHGSHHSLSAWHEVPVIQTFIPWNQSSSRRMGTHISTCSLVWGLIASLLLFLGKASSGEVAQTGHPHAQYNFPGGLTFSQKLKLKNCVLDPKS